jgi:salicylate hydroxylase
MGDIDLEIYPNVGVQRYLDRCSVKSSSTVYRARLLDAFLSLSPDGYASFNKALVRVKQDEKEVRLSFADGKEVHADAVIGCDGIKSQVRASIVKEEGVFIEPEYASEYCHRSLVDMDLAESILGLELAGGPTLRQGYGGYIIHYLVEKGRLLNVVAVRQERCSGEEHLDESLVKTVLREEMYDDFMDWDPRLVELLRTFKTSNRWSLWRLPHNQEYSRGRVYLLGDAAHASLPDLGSGVSMAIEDAYVLGNRIAKYGKKDLHGFQRAFWSYDHVRRPRTQKLLHKSQNSGRKHCLALPGVLDDIAALREYSKDQIQWVWDYDIEQDLERARAYWNVLLEQNTETERRNRVGGNNI